MPRHWLSWLTLFALSMCATVVVPAERNDAPRYLIIHADDAGMCHAANQATIEAMEQGIVSSASIMVPCPWFPEIAQYAKEHPERDFGIHLTLTSEWPQYRWGPVASHDKVPSLVDEKGFLWGNLSQVARHAKVDEVELELRAQIDRAIQFGVPITHLDNHMGSLGMRADLFRVYVKLGIEYDIPVLLSRSRQAMLADKFPGMAAEADSLAKQLEQHNLPVIDHLPTIPTPHTFEARKAVYVEAIRRLQPGVTQIIIHCGNDNPEFQAVCNRFASRDIDRRIFMDAGVKADVEKLGVKVITWKQLREMGK